MLAAFHMMIAGANFINGAAEIITEVAEHIMLDVCFAAAGSCQKDHAGNGLRTFDAFRMIVGYVRCGNSYLSSAFDAVVQPTSGGYPHGRPIAVAAVRLGILAMQPIPKR